METFNRAAAYAGAIIVGVALILIWMMLSSCESVPQRKSIRHGYARVTAYNPYERDRVRVSRGRRSVWRWIRWGRRTASGVRAVEGVTLAAPKQVPFGTRVCIPKLKGVVGTGEFIVQDRGAGATILKTPEWFDVFVDNHSKMKRVSTQLPEWMEYTLQ